MKLLFNIGHRKLMSKKQILFYFLKWELVEIFLNWIRIKFRKTEKTSDWLIYIIRQCIVGIFKNVSEDF